MINKVFTALQFKNDNMSVTTKVPRSNKNLKQLLYPT